MEAITTLIAAFTIVLAAVGIIGLALSVGLLVNGFTLYKLWAWFAVPIFGLPSLGIAQAIGVALLVTFMTHQRQDAKKPDPWWEPYMLTVIKAGVFLLVGWIVKNLI